MSDQNPTIVSQPKPSHPKFIDLEGMTFNRLTVLGYAGRIGRYTYWHTYCDCGNVSKHERDALTSGKTRSCGCLQTEARFRHAMSRSKEYRIFIAAKARCNNPKNPFYHRYGGRGIEFRFQNFEEFFDEVGMRPDVTHSLDRINNDGHYESGNVRWADRLTQQRNRFHSPKPIIHNGRVYQWEEISIPLRLSMAAIKYRYRMGWCFNCLSTLPAGSTCIHITDTSLPE